MLSQAREQLSWRTGRWREASGRELRAAQADIHVVSVPSTSSRYTEGTVASLDPLPSCYDALTDAPRLFPSHPRSSHTWLTCHQLLITLRFLHSLAGSPAA